ncbi:MAG: lipid-A-disaccharide synthase [Pseudanabaenaceae cyanobacterium SKYGB_i_bin29]|nr:lipid-A-disaccharide synthase [Pseudanabaenaceae cyanobacterium SKYG29]MDW8421295.1 lipid-A-disaccharide synthase [Pseudanabaenaceae cyanobacterium SKYGB_i_bin29]
MTYRIFISTGEVSGDLQGAALAQALYREAQAKNMPLTISGLGGEKMARAGVTLWGNTATIGSIGLLEALPFIVPSFQIQQQVRQKLWENPPHLAVFIDYVTPNLAMGKFLKRNFAVPIVYYIAPQEWVWEFGNNTQLITQFTDRILAVFPAEAEYYRRKGVNVTWVGHPLVEMMAQVPDRGVCRRELGIASDALVVTLLPASRRQEIYFLLPVMLEVARLLRQQLASVQFLLPLSLPRYRPQVEGLIAAFGLPIQVVENAHHAIRAADLALSKSGTVNLETALLGVPQVVLYRVSALTAWVARRIFRFQIPFMSPVNLVLMTEVVPEFFQEQVEPQGIAHTCLALLQDEQRRGEMLKQYAVVKSKLGDGTATTQAAQAILSML